MFGPRGRFAGVLLDKVAAIVMKTSPPMFGATVSSLQNAEGTKVTNDF